MTRSRTRWLSLRNSHSDDPIVTVSRNMKLRTSLPWSPVRAETLRYHGARRSQVRMRFS
jgi:hypothetical protein